MKVPSTDYTKLIAQMKSQKHIRKAVFVFPLFCFQTPPNSFRRNE
jgi:hypothetical protein